MSASRGLQRIGINALYLIPGGVGGTEIYLRSLLGALAEIDSANHYLIFTNRETPPEIVPPRENFRVISQPVPAVNRPARIVWEQTGLAAAVARERVAVLLNPGFTTPALCPCPTVTVFHDLQHKRHPEHFRRLDLLFWRLCLFQAACTSDRLITVSEATRRDLVHYYPVEPERVHVVAHGADESMFEVCRERAGVKPEPYVLCVSTLHPHKNLDRLIRAFAAFRSERQEFELVLAGMRGFHAEAVERLVESLGLGSTVRITGWITREEIRELYRRAHACVYPSTFEGFGLPVLESMAAGVPTACSSIPPLREVAGDAALLFDPLDEGELLAALRSITADQTLRERLAREGPRRAARFSWKGCARQTLEVLLEAAGSR